MDRVLQNLFLSTLQMVCISGQKYETWPGRPMMRPWVHQAMSNLDAPDDLKTKPLIIGVE